MRRLLIACVVSSALCTLGWAENEQERNSSPLSTTSSYWARSSAAELTARAARFEAENRLFEALRALTEAIRMDPTYGPAFMHLGALRERMADPAEAEKVYTRAVRIRESASDALAARGRLRRRQNRVQEAMRDLEAALELNPGDVAKLNVLASWYVERRAWPAALGVWRRILAVESNEDATKLARIQVLALSSLAGPTDTATRRAPSENWIRQAIAHIAARAPLPLHGERQLAP